MCFHGAWQAAYSEEFVNFKLRLSHKRETASGHWTTTYIASMNTKTINATGHVFEQIQTCEVQMQENVDLDVSVSYKGYHNMKNNTCRLHNPSIWWWRWTVFVIVIFTMVEVALFREWWQNKQKIKSIDTILNGLEVVNGRRTVDFV
jgi:hypothetical protein